MSFLEPRFFALLCRFQLSVSIAHADYKKARPSDTDGKTACIVSSFLAGVMAVAVLPSSLESGFALGVLTVSAVVTAFSKIGERV